MIKEYNITFDNSWNVFMLFEFIVLLMLLIISMFNVELTFKVMFASSIVVIIINSILIKDGIKN